MIRDWRVAQPYCVLDEGTAAGLIYKMQRRTPKSFASGRAASTTRRKSKSAIEN